MSDPRMMSDVPALTMRLEVVREETAELTVALHPDELRLAIDGQSAVDFVQNTRA